MMPRIAREHFPTHFRKSVIGRDSSRALDGTKKEWPNEADRARAHLRRIQVEGDSDAANPMHISK